MHVFMLIFHSAHNLCVSVAWALHITCACFFIIIFHSAHNLCMAIAFLRVARNLCMLFVDFTVSTQLVNFLVACYLCISLCWFFFAYSLCIPFCLFAAWYTMSAYALFHCADIIYHIILIISLFIQMLDNTKLDLELFD